MLNKMWFKHLENIPNKLGLMTRFQFYQDAACNQKAILGLNLIFC